jgi:hypothetical protein
LSTAAQTSRVTHAYLPAEIEGFAEIEKLPTPCIRRSTERQNKVDLRRVDASRGVHLSVCLSVFCSVCLPVCCLDYCLSRSHSRARSLSLKHIRPSLVCALAVRASCVSGTHTHTDLSLTHTHMRVCVCVCVCVVRSNILCCAT